MDEKEILKFVIRVILYATIFTLAGYGWSDWQHYVIGVCLVLISIVELFLNPYHKRSKR